MLRSIEFIFIGALLYSDLTLSYGQTLPQIKCLGSQANYLDTEYNSAVVLFLTAENETYNNVNLYWNLAKDLGQDLTLNTNVFATDKTFQGGELILNVSTPICQPSETRELLPKLFIVDPTPSGEPCMKKGIRELKDMGQFRFEVIVPNIESKGTYFRAEYAVHHSNRINYITNFYNELLI